MKIRKKIDNDTLSTILKAVMKKAVVKKIQLNYHDIENCKDEKLKIRRWKSGIFGNEIIDVEFLENEITI